jgi:hypothetical protein
MSDQPAETVIRRFNVGLPEPLAQELQRVADENGTTVVELLRRFTKLGLLAIRLQQLPDAGLIVRECGEEQKIMLL